MKTYSFKMYKLSRIRNVLWCGLFSKVELNDSDFENYKKAHGLYIEDPWERVKTIFMVDDYGSWHPELVHVLQVTQLGAFVGGVYGGIIRGIKEQEKYLRTTDTNIFANKKQANNAFFNHALLSFGKGAIRYAPKVAFFCGSFSFISSCCVLYKNKHGILENTLAGCLTGAICKFSFGLKGFVSGGIIGGLLGTIYGVTMWGLEKVFQKDQLELKYAQFAYSQYKKRLKNNLFEKTDLETLHVSHIENPLDNLAAEKKFQEAEEEKRMDKT